MAVAVAVAVAVSGGGAVAVAVAVAVAGLTKRFFNHIHSKIPKFRLGGLGGPLALRGHWTRHLARSWLDRAE